MLNLSTQCFGFLFAFHLQAWDEFVKISFPDEQFTEKWKKTLLADLEKRIQEVWAGAYRQSLHASGPSSEQTDSLLLCLANSF